MKYIFWVAALVVIVLCYIPAIAGRVLYKYFTEGKDPSDFNR